MALVASAGPPAQAQTPFGTPPAVPAGASLGAAVPGSTPLHLTFVLQPTDPAALAAEVQAISTPGSPSYAHYLTTAQFAQRFGASDATIQALTGALRAEGLPAPRVAANHLSVSLDAPASTVEQSLHPGERTTHLKNGRTAYQNTAPPQLPASVAPAVRAVLGLDTIAQATPQEIPTRKAAAPATQAPEVLATPAAAGPVACTAASTAATHYGAYVPAQVASAYGFGSLYANNHLGAGQTIALFELATFSSSDIAAYQSCFGTSTQVSVVQVDTGSAGQPGTVESTLDIDDVIGMAPQAAIKVYEGHNSGQGIYNEFSKIVSDNLAKVVSTSWGICESIASQGGSSSLTSAENSLFSEAAVQGQTILAATGDQGAEACYDPTQPIPDTSLAVSDPASQLNVTAVGGTELNTVGPPPTEVAYNEGTGGGAGGGGISTLWTMPSWQTGTGVVNSFSSGTPCGAAAGSYCREVPDVSASSNPTKGYVMYYTGGEQNIPAGWSGIAGTSAAAPLWGALIALANEQCGVSLGAVNAALYKADAAGGAFNDVTTGNIALVGNHGTDYPAGAGYDLATGLGSPIAGTLVPDLCPPSPPAFTADSPPAQAALNTQFSYTFAASGSPVPTFTLASGTLPTGLSLDAAGVLSGIPSATGSFTFTVKATNANGSATSPQISMTIGQGPAFTADAPPATTPAGSALSYTFTASGSPAPTFALATGSLPPGLSLAASGALTGTPTAGGSYNFTVSASNSFGTATSPTITMTVTQAPAFTADSPPTSATIQVVYTYQFAASGYPVPTFSLASGSLPPGIALSAAGLLSGSPTTAGSFTFTVSASNSVGSASSPSFTITVSNAPSFTADSPPALAAVGTAYAYAFAAGGSPAPTFSVQSGSLPPGLTLDSATGALSGTPTVAGQYHFVVAATNSSGTAATPTLTITVTQPPAFTAAAPQAVWVVGAPYSYAFAASGFPGPTFSVASGALPPGLTLDGATGVLSGIPSAAGAFSFTVQAGNGIGMPAVTPSLTIVIVVAGPERSGNGYWEVASDGGLFSYGDAGFFGSAGAIHLNQPIVGMVATPDGKGYWEVASDGGLFSYGDAGFFGSAGAIHLNQPIVGMVATPDGKGYWEVASDGGLFSYGDAGFFGSAGSVHLNQPIVGMAATPDGKGYWEVASDGGLFSYGDAVFYGSAGSVHLNQPIVGMAATPDGKGYWEVASDGGLFSYGDAGFVGSAGSVHLNQPIVGLSATPDGKGYWEVASDGGLFSHGDATFHGSAGSIHLNKPIVGMFSD